MKKGFTLIELLAVIVILAIIALIATPIVLSIINDSKESATLRSADFYLDGVELSVSQAILKEINIQDGTYDIMQDGNICIGTLNADTCTGEILKVEVDGEVPTSGTVTITKGEITGVELTYPIATIVMDDDNNLVFEEKKSETLEGELSKLCTYDATNGVAEKTSGAKYECEVKPGTSYNFYVLTTPKETDTSINLIMDRNIYYDATAGTGSEATSTNKGLVDWITDSTYGCVDNGEPCAATDKGPITAMTYLYNATKDWTNISPLNYTYNDKEMQGKTDGVYTSFVSTNGVAVITPLTGEGVTIGSETTPLRARMPIYSSDASKTEVANYNGKNAYLYEYLEECKSEDLCVGVPTTNNINGIQGYWTLSSNVENSSWAMYVSYEFWVNSDNVYGMYGPGVRPVINLKI